jgi:ATP-dependent Lhr-like helicase
VTSAFSRFPARLQEAIVARLGWTSLRPVQEEASHALLDGCNAVILAPTAGGKTEAAIFPLLAEMVADEPKAVGILYVAPIKALLNNQAERLKTYAEMVGLRRFLWHGDTRAAERRAFLREPAQILMTTPESLEVMLLSSQVPHQRLFSDLRAVVVDEIHAMAGLDRGAHLMSILERLAPLSRHDLQRVGLSATVGNPADILAWLQGTSRRPGRVVNPRRQKSQKELGIRLFHDRQALARSAAALAEGRKSLFFCQSRALTEEVAEKIRKRGTDVFVHHSSVSLEERVAAEERFHQGRNAVIVCTSTLELGIDVGNLDRILQANAPSTVSSFLQRMGRTGRRAGQRANTLFLCENSEVVLQAAALIELAREGRVESVEVQTRCWPVLVHQLLALALEHGAVSPEHCWNQLCRVPDFKDITRQEFDELVRHLVREEYLFPVDGKLSMGDAAERAFGRKNFLELYAVFSTPQLYSVVTRGGKPLGSLEQNFVDKLVEKVTCFLLGGRAWVAELILHSESKVVVSPAPRGRKPSWGGYVPQFLGYELCQKMAEILASDAPIPYLDAPSAAALGQMRAELGRSLRSQRWYEAKTPDGEYLWTFAGGAVNLTLKYGLQHLRNWTAASDNFRLKFPEGEVTPRELREALERLADPCFWEEPELRERLPSILPEYRLSKFQRALPHKWAMEMVKRYLLDVPTTLRFLNAPLPRLLQERRPRLSTSFSATTGVEENPPSHSSPAGHQCS